MTENGKYIRSFNMPDSFSIKIHEVYIGFLQHENVLSELNHLPLKCQENR